MLHHLVAVSATDLCTAVTVLRQPLDWPRGVTVVGRDVSVQWRHISNSECASDSPLLSAKLKEAHALLEAERLEAFAPTGKKADSATFTNPLDEQDARDDSDGDGDGEDGGGGDDNRT